MSRRHGGSVVTRLAFLALAVVPAFVLALLVWTLSRDSRLALDQIGLGRLLSTEWTPASSLGPGVFGLVPGIWGTVLAAAVALAIAIPASACAVLLQTEFPLGRASRALEAVLGALSGIPPIVYSLMGIVLARALIEPKLAAVNLPEEVASALPGLPIWSTSLLPKAMPNSTLLAGLLVGLLVVPFMSPLILDAVRSVPASLREASLALGANRSYTVRRVLLPSAMPGIVAAVAMGTLKAVGDVVIVSYAVGYSGSLPSPFWDVLERVPTLTSAGAGLMGGMTVTAEGVTELDRSVGSFTGLLLLAFAVVVLVGSTGVERILRGRMDR